MSFGNHHNHEDYSVDTYINYARSVSLAMERRMMDLKPKRAAVFWRWFEEEMQMAKWRMHTCNPHFSSIPTKKP